MMNANDDYVQPPLFDAPSPAPDSAPAEPDPGLPQEDAAARRARLRSEWVDRLAVVIAHERQLDNLTDPDLPETSPEEVADMQVELAIQRRLAIEAEARYFTS